jgi:hypothetical protein
MLEDEMNKAAEIVKSYVAEQTVVVLEEGRRAFPEERFVPAGQPGAGFCWPAEVLREEAGRAAEEMLEGEPLGFALFSTKGGWSYQFRVHVVTPTGHVLALDTPAASAEEAEEMIKGWHARHLPPRLLPLELERVEGEMASKLDRELRRHDWFADMSDSYAVTRAARKHMEETIVPLLLALPESKGREIWDLHAPEEIGRDPYARFR